MKIMVIGGTGVFGARMCVLLARDGHDVTIASRTKPAPSHTKMRRVRRMGIVQGDETVLDLSNFAYRKFDRDGPLTGFNTYNVIVDAAGPFHAYGTDPYRIAKAAIAAGAHYFDLSDNADFCEGVRILNADAKAAGVTVLSGMSSVPAISSAVVEDLRAGQTPVQIDSAILPGNKAPRGRAVVESILNQTGTYFVAKRGGRSVQVRSWSGPRLYDLGTFKRQAWHIEVPDQRMFPDHFKCPTVDFRASLELGVMRYGLAALSFLRSKFRFGMPRWLVSFVMFAARMMAPFGTDRGGMVVSVIVPQNSSFVQKRWVLRANSGDGPFVPGIAIRAACRMLEQLAPGAEPALSATPLTKIEQAMSDLDIETHRSEVVVKPIFKQVLANDFYALPKAVQTTHNGVGFRHFEGRASVSRGRGLLARLAAIFFGFPPTSHDVAVTVTKLPAHGGETWIRQFGQHTFRSHLRPKGGRMTERFGLLTFELGLQVLQGRLLFPVLSGHILGLPIPRFLLPQSVASEADVGGVFHFDVHLKAPTGTSLVHYKGWLGPVGGTKNT